VQLRRCLFDLHGLDSYDVHIWLIDYQVDSEQRPHKVSFYVDKGVAEQVIRTLTERFREREVRCPCQCILQGQRQILGSWHFEY
jgi:hypothetical protein